MEGIFADYDYSSDFPQGTKGIFLYFMGICRVQAGMSVYFAERIMFNSRQSADYRRSIFTGECTREIRISDREI